VASVEAEHISGIIQSVKCVLTTYGLEGHIRECDKPRSYFGISEIDFIPCGKSNKA